MTDPHISDCGILYIATSEKYVSEAERSARSVLQHNDIQIAIRVNSEESVDSNLFDYVLPARRVSHDYGDSIFTLEDTPFKKTIFLDTDTYICGDITELFDALDRFDLLAAHNPGSRTSKERGGFVADVPEVFPLYNTGVLIFNCSSDVKNLLIEWENTYDNKKEEIELNLNQPAFREALYNSTVSIGTLPSEYNLRIHNQGSVGFVSDKVRIVHGRHPAGLDTVANTVNESKNMRVFAPQKWPLAIYSRRPSFRYLIRHLLREDSSEGLKNRFITSVKQNGLRKTIKKSMQWKADS